MMTLAAMGGHIRGLGVKQRARRIILMRNGKRGSEGNAERGRGCGGRRGEGWEMLRRQVPQDLKPD